MESLHFSSNPKDLRADGITADIPSVALQSEKSNSAECRPAVAAHRHTGVSTDEARLAGRGMVA
jgi:hypothetical protein